MKVMTEAEKTIWATVFAMEWRKNRDDAHVSPAAEADLAASTANEAVEDLRSAQVRDSSMYNQVVHPDFKSS